MKYIPYGRQWIDDDDIRAVVKVIKSDWLTQGPTIKEFETALCIYTGARYTVAVSSGTAALHIACLAAGIKTGDEIITTPMTFVASANCALYCGAMPIFADIEKCTANIDPVQIEKKISKKTRMIIPVHFAGHPCEMKEISAMAKKNNLLVIEDAAHALGAKYCGSKIGSCRYSDMTTLSFHPVKHITTGEGGAVLTNRRDLYEKLLVLRTHGITKNNLVNKPDGEWYYEMQQLGYNYRITDIQAALGISQLKKLDKFVKRRREIAEIYRSGFKNNPYFDMPAEKGYAYSSYHIFPIKLKNNLAGKRKEIFSEFRRNGIGAQVHYIPVYRHPYYKNLGYKSKDYPNTEDFYSREISIPLYPLMKNSDVRYVIKKIRSVLNTFK